MQSILRFLSFSLTFIGCVVCLEPQCKRPPTTPCCYNEYLDPNSKRCKACEPGRIGWNCRERCVRGYYGSLCRQKCACSSDHCNPVVGCLTTAMATSASGFATEDGRKPQADQVTPPVRDFMTNDPLNPYRSAKTTLIKVSTTIRTDIRTDGHKDNERRSTDDLTVPDVLGDSLSLLMTLMVVALFLLVVGLAFIIGLLSFITLKLRKGAHIPTGMKLVSMSDSYPLPQPWDNLESGYMVLGRRQRPLTGDRQSGYTNPLSREVVSTTSI
uniref:Uncharacterized protein LOC111135013 isoform X2 n=1 Tax=Crassostrea virginica TaxID=6565 RepID=A0A8B8EL60_CRAVI|nr:uncharacterized protein LOC111135013 isoform X2 [Crassostrea virginica]